jgi:hypothetical protein
MSYYKCTQCDWEGDDALLSWSGPHVKVDCPNCKRYIKFAKQNELDSHDGRILQDWQAEQVKEANENDTF